MVRGAQHCAGELGQTSIDYNGRIGKYNNPGCLEEYLGNNEFARDAQTAYATNNIQKTVTECTPQLIAEAATSAAK